MARAEVLSELLLERGDVRAEDEAPVLEHVQNRLVELAAKRRERCAGVE